MEKEKKNPTDSITRIFVYPNIGTFRWSVSRPVLFTLYRISPYRTPFRTRSLLSGVSQVLLSGAEDT